MNNLYLKAMTNAWVRRLALMIFLAATASGPASAAPQIETPGFYITTLGLTADQVGTQAYTAEGDFIPLQNAAAFAFAEKDDVVFVVEKFGTVRVIVDGELQEKPVVDMRDQVSDWVDSGMGGVAVHPDFPEVKEIIVSYTHHNGVTPIADGSKYAKVARLTLTETVGSNGLPAYFGEPPTDNDVIVGKLSSTAEFPSCNDRPLGADCGAVDHAAHSFTFVRYGPDGKIYIGTGDGAGYFSPDPHALYAQVNGHLSGKVLRVNPDGSGPEDNPFFTGNKWDNESKVFAKGLRNPKSGGFNPETGQFCVGNVGWFLTEGIYCLSPGDNAGWPCEENGPAFNGYETLSLSRDGERLASCPLEPGTYVQPDYSYAHQLQDIDGELLPIGAVIGCATATAEEYPDNFKGTCVFGDYVFDTIESVRLGQQGGNPSSSLILSGAGLPTDVATDRNGRICYLAYSVAVIDGRPVSELRCIRYDKDGTVPQFPVPSFISFPAPGSDEVIKFDASGSYHTGGKALTYSWDFGDGSTGTGITTEHTYSKSGDFRVTLTVSTLGEDVSRSTFQIVRVQDPSFITPIKPSVVDVQFRSAEHFVTSQVEFDVEIRNDKGADEFNVLTNIYNSEGQPVAHLVHQELVQLDPGESATVTFLWKQGASDLGNHTIGVEFYAADWVSWTLKYADVAGFFVRNRVSGETPDPGAENPGTEPPDAGETPPDAGENPATPADDPVSGSSGGSGNGCTIGSANGSLLWMIALFAAAQLMRKKYLKIARH